MIWSSAVEAQEAVGCVTWQQEHPCSPASRQESSWEHQTCLSSRGPLASLPPNPLQPRAPAALGPVLAFHSLPDSRPGHLPPMLP